MKKVVLQYVDSPLYQSWPWTMAALDSFGSQNGWRSICLLNKPLGPELWLPQSEAYEKLLEEASQKKQDAESQEVADRDKREEKRKKKEDLAAEKEAAARELKKNQNEEEAVAKELNNKMEEEAAARELKKKKRGCNAEEALKPEFLSSTTQR